MLAFKVEIDGEHITTAGMDDWSVLALHVSASRGESEAAFASARIDQSRFSVGGLSLPDQSGVSFHFRWPEKQIQVGSVVVVTVVESDAPTPPAKGYRSDVTVQEDPFTDDEMKQLRFLDYLELKKEFEDGKA